MTVKRSVPKKKGSSGNSSKAGGGTKQKESSVPKKKRSIKQPDPEPESDDDDSSTSSHDEPQVSKDTLQTKGDSSSSSSSSALDDDSSQDGSDSSSAKEVTATRFTDENAAWLKPKKNSKSELLSSDDEDVGVEDEDEEELEIERETRLLDQELEAEQQEADEEMRLTVRQQTAIYHLPTVQELEQDANRVVPPSEIRSHMESILEVLADFGTRREPGRARSEYVTQLGVWMAELYGYLPELIEYFLSMLGPAETLEFVDASDKPRSLVIRTNTLKTRRKDLAAALMKRGVSLDPLASWSKVGLKILESPVPVGATPEYLSGQYMLQSAASMCPVLALAPQPKERVLDMSAAPGGKTSYCAQLMRNTGTILANDLRPERQKATVANMHRLGVKNVVACAYDGRKLGALFPNRFDRILLDAPCSGLGVISRDPSVKVQRTLADVKQCAHLQKELLIAAIDALKYKGTTGGVLVYSTCSVSVAENEEVVSYALSKRDIRIIDTGLDFGKPGFVRFQQKRFHPTVALTRRFYPHVHNMDGFFVCKIQKLSDRRPEDTLEPDAEDAPMEATNEGETEALNDEPDKKKKGKRGTDTKRKRKAKDMKPSKSSQVSILPKKSKPKKEKKNAKVTKPRRPKASGDA